MQVRIKHSSIKDGRMVFEGVWNDISEISMVDTIQ